MSAALFFVVIVALVLGMCMLTTDVLDTRQEQRNQGHDVEAYL